ncbi:TIGR03960 family B12-binding radical SAM protein [Thermovorax subterraneus]|nr:TIGR03960 family B12-binding radical SAM protein [Thermovorax subterraneus]
MEIENINILDEILPKVSKPMRYVGNELNSVKKDKNDIKVHIALAFPDVYEVGMSHLGLRILYHLLNEREDVYAERVFAPWIDMEDILRQKKIPLFSLESKTPLSEFDMIGFSLQYEMSYSNVLNMLELSGVPIFSSERKENDPIVIAGGPCAYNPEPLAEIIDLFVIGEAEESILELVDLYIDWKECSAKRSEFLEGATQIPGIYVPSLYRVTYHEDGTVREILPRKEGVPERVKKRFIEDLDKVYYPTKLIVPYTDIVHDRAVLEIFRGCTRGCRFCQAGMIYRPVREKSAEKLADIARKMIDATGYEEISLASLSTSDYSDLKRLVEILTAEFKDQRVGISLPSLRIDSFTLELARRIMEIKKSGLTFAPEAGTQRLRDVINKGVTEEDLLNSVRGAFEAGWNSVKLYFMIGLPTETYEDLEGIVDLAHKVVDVYREVKGKSKGLRVTVSTSTFVPKPFTPFQWEAQITLEEINERQKFLKKKLKNPHIIYNWHDGRLSFLEAVFSRGDRRLNLVLKKAREKGCRFDGWSDIFDFSKWMEAFSEAGLDPGFYANRPRLEGEFFPWEVIDPGIDRHFLLRELKKAKMAQPTPDCRVSRCQGCGIIKIKGGIRCEVKNED